MNDYATMTTYCPFATNRYEIFHSRKHMNQKNKQKVQKPLRKTDTITILPSLVEEQSKIRIIGFLY